MPRVLLAGFDARLKGHLKSRMGEYPISHVSNAIDLQEELAGGSVSLLILDHEIDGASGLEALKGIRANLQWEELPVIYYAGKDSAADLKIAKELRVSGILMPPLDPNELAVQAAGMIGVTPHPSNECGDVKIQRVLEESRTRFLGTLVARLEPLERAGVALLEDNLRPDLRETARHEAHKLAGLMGTLGFGPGSRFAREMEEILSGSILSGAGQAMRYSELLAALRLDVEKALAAPMEIGRPDVEYLSLLIVDRNKEFDDRLEAEALRRGVQVLRVENFEEAAVRVMQDPPDVVLADLLLSGNEEEGLDFLEKLAGGSPPIPTIVLTSKGTFTDRVEVARRGGRGFLSKDSSAMQILDAVLRLVDRLHAADPRIMAVDDDPQVLALLRSLLEPRGISMKTLDAPLEFWEALESFAPDLLVLDVDMPCLSGIEICRVVRNDARWAETPVIFLTRHDDPETIQRVFSSGSDDFVAKPIVGPELLTRIFNRLERVRMQRNLSETDLLTGALNRGKSSHMIADFLDLARKHEQPLVLAVLEIENLVQINQSYGQTAGDIALERTARLLKQAFRSEDIFARWGGGEFVAGMYGLTRYDGVERLTELLEQVHEQAFRSPSGTEFQIKACAGVAQYSEDGANLEELYKSALGALSEAKKAGGGRAVPAGWVPDQQEGGKRLDVTLVMRDEAQALLLLHTLESRGIRARWLRDGRTAEKLLAGPQPALHSKVVLMEVDLPDLDGISLLKQFGAANVLGETRVIMITTPSVSNEAQAVLELGAFDYVAKPLNPHVVAKHIRRALDGI